MVDVDNQHVVKAAADKGLVEVEVIKSEREKGNQNEPGSLHCCKSSCYFDIAKKLNLKQDRVNLVNLLI